MAIRKGLPAKLALTDADDTRYLFSGLVVCNVDGSPRGGVLSPVGVNLVTATATMNVSVARFQGAAVRDGGVILLSNDGAANVLLDAAPGANSRIDVIYSKQNDASGTVTVPDADNAPILGFVKGTAGAVPVKPTLPIGALELATVQIPSGATATNSGGVVITQTAAFTASGGATVSFRTKAALDLWVTAQDGQRASVLADGVSYVSLSSAWKRGELTQWQADTTNSVKRVITQVGIGKIVGTNTGTTSEAVTFPIPFSSTPVVQPSSMGFRTAGAFNPVGLSTAQSVLGTAAQATTTGFNAFLYQTTGTNLTSANDWYYSWTAVGEVA